jgi:hypothetical protein
MIEMGGFDPAPASKPAEGIWGWEGLERERDWAMVGCWVGFELMESPRPCIAAAGFMERG